MIGDQRPSKTKGLRLGDDITLAFNKIIPVLIIGKYSLTHAPTNNNMMIGSGSIDACMRGIKLSYYRTLNYKSYYFMGVPKSVEYHCYNEVSTLSLTEFK